MRRLSVVIGLLLMLSLPGCVSAPRASQTTTPAPVASSSVQPTPSVQSGRIPVPLVKGKSVDMAEWKLQQSGFATEVRWKSSSIRRGKVLAQNPSSGTAPAGTTVVLTVSSGTAGSDAEQAAAPNETVVSASDQAAALAFQNHSSDLALTGEGTVARVLADDNSGGRHQRFILRLRSGQTLLVAHNIDIAPRLPSLAAGDVVAFKGIYEWNDEGGVVHWTHHDPDGTHPAGWLKLKGATYQ